MGIVLRRCRMGLTPGGQLNSPYAAMGDLSRSYFGLQFHPEGAIHRAAADAGAGLY